MLFLCFPMLFNDLFMLFQCFSMLLNTVSMLFAWLFIALSCFFNAFHCLFNTFSMLFHAFQCLSMLFQCFFSAFQCFSMLVNAFKCFANAFQCFFNAFHCFLYLFICFSIGFAVVCKIYLGFLRFLGKVAKNTKNEFLGAGCPSGWSGQTPPTPLPPLDLTEVSLTHGGKCVPGGSHGIRWVQFWSHDGKCLK